MIEEWRNVVGWETSFQVSNFGNVRAKERTFERRHNKTDRLVAFTYAAHPVRNWIAKNTGYPMVNLQLNGKAKAYAVHVLVLEAFTGPRPFGYVTCHNDGSRTNNTLPNLRWDTYAGNCADMVKHGTHARGERNWKARLTEFDVLNVRRRLANGEQCAAISRDYGVTPEAISHIKLRKNWAWLD